MLVIIATHPIQYQVPIWKELAKRLDVKFEVWYLTSHGIRPTEDIQFGKKIKWDIDLLDGYTYKFSDTHCPIQLTDFWSAKLPNDFKSRLKSDEIAFAKNVLPVPAGPSINSGFLRNIAALTTSTRSSLEK